MDTQLVQKPQKGDTSNRESQRSKAIVVQNVAELQRASRMSQVEVQRKSISGQSVKQSTINSN
jgi:hypothetical protein